MSSTGGTAANGVDPPATSTFGDHRLTLWDGVLMRLVGFSCVGGFLFGYDTGVTSGALVFLKDHFDLDYFQEEEVVASTVLAAAIGCVLVGVPMANYGRRPMLFVTTLLYASGALTVASAADFTMVLCGRVILGFGVGMASILSPVYIAEAAPSSWRAGLVALNTLMIVLGQVFSCLVNAAVDDMSYSYNWRISMGFAAAPALFMFVGLFSLPESPRWLLSKGREDEARSSLAQIRGADNDPTEELKVMADGIAAEQSDMSFVDMWKYKPIRNAFIVGCALGLFQQLAAINTLMYYGAIVMEMAGFPSSASIELTAVLAMAQGVGVCISLYLYSILPRRTVLLWSIAGVTLGLGLIGIAFENIDEMQGLAVFAVIFYLVCFGLGYSAAPTIVASEIYPTHARSYGVSQVVFCMWAGNFVVSATFLTETQTFGVDYTFYIYTAVTAIAWVYIYFELPETSGKTMEQIWTCFCGKNEGGKYVGDRWVEEGTVPDEQRSLMENEVGAAAEPPVSISRREKNS